MDNLHHGIGTLTNLLQRYIVLYSISQCCQFFSTCSCNCYCVYLALKETNRDKGSLNPPKMIYFLFLKTTNGIPKSPARCAAQITSELVGCLR